MNIQILLLRGGQLVTGKYKKVRKGDLLGLNLGNGCPFHKTLEALRTILLLESSKTRIHID